MVRVGNLYFQKRGLLVLQFLKLFQIYLWVFPLCWQNQNRDIVANFRRVLPRDCVLPPLSTVWYCKVVPVCAVSCQDSRFDRVCSEKPMWCGLPLDSPVSLWLGISLSRYSFRRQSQSGTKTIITKDPVSFFRLATCRQRVWSLHCHSNMQSGWSSLFLYLYRRGLKAPAPYTEKKNDNKLSS